MDSKSKTAKTTLNNIPRTGRIGRFVKILEGQVDDKHLLSIIEGSLDYNSLKSDQKAQWLKQIHTVSAPLSSIGSYGCF